MIRSDGKLRFLNQLQRTGLEVHVLQIGLKLRDHLETFTEGYVELLRLICVSSDFLYWSDYFLYVMGWGVGEKAADYENEGEIFWGWERVGIVGRHIRWDF